MISVAWNELRDFFPCIYEAGASRRSFDLCGTASCKGGVVPWGVPQWNGRTATAAYFASRRDQDLDRSYLDMLRSLAPCRTVNLHTLPDVLDRQEYPA